MKKARFFFIAGAAKHPDTQRPASFNYMHETQGMQYQAGGHRSFYCQKAEERTYARSSALIAWTEHSGIEFQEIDKVSQIRLSSHCFHLSGILLQTGVFKRGILC